MVKYLHVFLGEFCHSLKGKKSGKNIEPSLANNDQHLVAQKSLQDVKCA